jgi:hypothetical protein
MSRRVGTLIGVSVGALVAAFALGARWSTARFEARITVDSVRLAAGARAIDSLATVAAVVRDTARAREARLELALDDYAALRSRLALQVAINTGLARTATALDGRGDSLAARLAWREQLAAGAAGDSVHVPRALITACDAIAEEARGVVASCRRARASDSLVLAAQRSQLSSLQGQLARVAVREQARATRRSRWSTIRTVVGCAGAAAAWSHWRPQATGRDVSAACAAGAVTGATAPTVLRFSLP